MKWFKIVFWLVLFSCIIYAEGLKPKLANGNITNHYAVRIYYDSEMLRLNIVTTFEPLEINTQEHYVVVEVDKEEHQKLLNLELNVTIDRNYTERLNYVSPASTQVKNTKSLNFKGYTTIPNYPCYRTVEGTFLTAEDIVKQHPNLAQWIDVGDSWKKENGLGGYDMKVLKITNLSHTGPKPALFITSSIHAREYAPAELATRFAEYLVNHYGVDADITWMLDYHEVHLMLMSNPDGRKEAEAGDYWRKNVNDSYCVGGSRKGADLNRNFNFKWNCCGGSSNYECAQTYHGSAPASEPETEAIQRYMLHLFGDHRADNLNSPAPLNTSGIYLDIHSYSKLILWPWGFSGINAPNNMVSLGRKFAYFNHYTPKQAYGLYPTDGTTDDYAYGELGIPSYTFELGTAFFQDCNIFNQTIVPDNIPSLLYALKAVRTPYTLAMGPEIKNITLNVGTTTSQGTLVTLTARADDTLYNNSHGHEAIQNIVQAQYYIDTPPWINGAHAISMHASDTIFNSPRETITQTINTSTLSIGKHIIFVRAKDANNHWGTVSAIFLTITENPYVIPLAPNNLNTSHITINSVTLTWRDTSNNEKGFKIYRSGSNIPIAIVERNTTSKTIDGLIPDTNYTYVVKAYNSTGESGGCSTTFKTLMAKPLAPSNLNVGNITEHNGTLTWSDNSNNEKGFKIYRSGSNIPIATVGENAISTPINGLTPNTNYTYIVKAYNAAGQSTGISKTFKTKAETTTIPTIPFNTNKSDIWDTHTASTHRSGRYAKFYTFRLTQSTEVTIDLRSSKDTYLYLLQGNGKYGIQITYNDDGGSGLNSKIIRTLSAGSYTIEATTFSKDVTGTFGLKVSTKNHAKSIPPITFNTNTNGTWDMHTASTHRSGRYAKFYTFRLTQSTEVTIDLRSSKDTYLYLLQGNGKHGIKITYNDDGGLGLNSKITRTLSAGSYTIEATTFAKVTTGAFLLKVTTQNIH